MNPDQQHPPTPLPGGLRVSLRRQRYFLDYSLASMARHPGRYGMVFGVYALLILLLTSVLLYSEALDREAQKLLAEAPSAVVQRGLAGRHAPIPATHIAELQGIRGLQLVEGRLWGYYFDPVVQANYTVIVPPATAGAAPAVGEMHLGASLALARGADVGDIMTFRRMDGERVGLRLSALLPASSNLVTGDLMLMAEADFRAVFGVPEGYYTDLALHIANPREVANIAARVLERLPDVRIILREDMQRTYAAIFDWRGTLVLLPWLGSLLAFAILAWNQAAGLSAEERRTIGTLKAIGWETRDILRMKLFEGLSLSLLAYSVGSIAAYWHVFGTGAALFTPVLQGWSVLSPAFSLTPSLTPGPFITVAMLTVLPYTAATLLPAWRAATLDPDQVLR